MNGLLGWAGFSISKGAFVYTSCVINLGCLPGRGAYFALKGNDYPCRQRDRTPLEPS